MKAKIVSIENGLQEYEDVEMIRVKSKHHNLLIMQHYMPVLGELDGYVEIVLKDHSVRFPKIKGYYMHKQDEFQLLAEELGAQPVSMPRDDEDYE